MASRSVSKEEESLLYTFHFSVGFNIFLCGGYFFRERFILGGLRYPTPKLITNLPWTRKRCLAVGAPLSYRHRHSVTLYKDLYIDVSIKISQTAGLIFP